MRLALFEGPGGSLGARPGVVTSDGIIDVSRAVGNCANVSAQLVMEQLIDTFEDLRDGLDRLVRTSPPIPLEVARIRAPLPRPGKMLNCIGNYWEHSQREPRPLNLFLKNPDAVIGDGDAIVLPRFSDENEYGNGPGPYVFQHEAELALVIRGPVKDVRRSDWRKAVFGVTGIIDVSARASGRGTWRQGSWMGKSFDTFAPLGPCITTLDEVGDPNKLRIRFFNNGDLYHDYTTDDMEHQVPELIEFASGIMTLHTGDVIACGTNHEGLGALQDGDHCQLEVARVGTLSVYVRDPLRRSWERGVYMGPNSTNPEAVRRRLADANQAGAPAAPEGSRFGVVG